MPEFNVEESRGNVRGYGSQEDFRPERSPQGEVDHRLREAPGAVRRLDGGSEEGGARPLDVDQGSAGRSPGQAEEVARIGETVDLEHSHVDARIFARYGLGMSNAATTPAPDALPVRAGHLGISYPKPATRLGPYSALDERDPASPSNPRVPLDTCGDCCNRSSFVTVEYGGEVIGACDRCLSGLVANGAEILELSR